MCTLVNDGAGLWFSYHLFCFSFGGLASMWCLAISINLLAGGIDSLRQIVIVSLLLYHHIYINVLYISLKVEIFKGLLGKFAIYIDNTSSRFVEGTRQIWGIWKLRPAYSPEMPNLGQNRWCFVPCDLEIWWMTLENNRASLLCCFKLCATFHSHRWIQTGVAVRKRPIWVKFDDF